MCDPTQGHKAIGFKVASVYRTYPFLAMIGNDDNPRMGPDTVVVWNMKHKVRKCGWKYAHYPQKVRYNDQYIFVCFSNFMRPYRLVKSWKSTWATGDGQPNDEPKHMGDYDTAANPHSLLCLGDQFAVFPGITPGSVQILNLKTQKVDIVPAHNGPLRALELSPDEEILATASEKGTIIRIWSTRDRVKLAEFRRGMDPALIYSLSISPNSFMLAATSDKSTLHIFDLPHPTKPNPVLQRPTPSEPTQGPSSNASESKSAGTWELMETPSLEEIAAESGSRRSRLARLGKLPLPGLRDTHGFVKASFETGPLDEGDRKYLQEVPPGYILGLPGGRPSLGIVGWVDDSSLLVVSAGENARWEQYNIVLSGNGTMTRGLVRMGWAPYMQEG